MSTKALIMAGGMGTRFWPKSTADKPKQFLKITSDRTMIQETFARINHLIPGEDIYLVTNKDHENYIFDQLDVPKENVLLEPAMRNTAAAIGYGMVFLDMDDILIVLPSDHYIADVERYLETLRVAIEFAMTNDALITLGIKPTRPETGYGYIEVTDVSPQLMRVYPVKRFREKPNLETSYTYLETGRFFWNSGMFIFKVSVMEEAFKMYMPRLYEAIQTMKMFRGKENFPGIVGDEYEKLESISIDYGVLERAANVYVIPSEFGWSDVGSWDALYELSVKDSTGNHIEAKEAVVRDTSNCMILAEGKRVAIAHVENLIVITDDDTILIMKRGTSQDVKMIAKG